MNVQPAMHEPSSETGVYAHSERLQRLDAQLVQTENILPTLPEEARPHLAATIMIARALLSGELERVDDDGGVSQTGTYVQQAPPLNGLRRAIVKVSNMILGLGVYPGLPTELLRAGCKVWVDKNTTQITAIAAPDQEGAKVMRVVRDTPVPVRDPDAPIEEGVGVTYLEVEDPTGNDVKVKVSITDDLADQASGQLMAGTGVWVKDGWAHEVDVDFKPRATFLEERLWPSGGFEHAVPMSFGDLKGQKALIKKFRMLVNRIAHPERYPGLEFMGNIQKLLVGPPGNGKTMAFQVLAWELHRQLGDRFKAYFIPASAMKDKYVGNTGKNLRAIFEQASSDFRKHGIISLIAFDEFESVGTARESIGDNTGVQKNMVATMLSYLDGAISLPGVITLAMSNFPEMLDPALLRPLRFGGRNLLTLEPLGKEDVGEIVADRIVQLRAATDGSTADQFASAVSDALALKLGTVKATNERIDIHGEHVTSGALATDAVRAGLEMMHEHIDVCEEQGVRTVFDRLSPAHLYHGTIESLNSVMDTLAGERNIGRARRQFSGNLVDPDDIETLGAVRHLAPGELAAVPDRYDLGPARELEAGAGGM